MCKSNVEGVQAITSKVHSTHAEVIAEMKGIISHTDFPIFSICPVEWEE